MSEEGRAAGATRIGSPGDHAETHTATSGIEHTGSDHAATDRAEAERAARTTGLNQGMQVLSYLISGVVCYGLLGWLGDHLLGTGFLLPLGIVVGAGLGAYVIIRRFGQLGQQTTGMTRRTTDNTKGIT